MAELRPSGFPEYSPGQQLIFDQIIATIEKQYQQFWYSHIHTPAVERNDTLLAKNGAETGKQIFGLYGMAQGAEDLKDYGLHFDLTVPFARYTLDRESQLTFPFKRYQIQPVWRGERAQKGRFREFFQCDIDVIWRGEKELLYYDAEIIAVLAQTLQAIFRQGKISDTAVFHISNKKLINALLAELIGEETTIAKVISLIDKFKKIGAEKFTASLREDLQLTPETVQKILDFVSFQSNNFKEIEMIGQFAQSEDFTKGVGELLQVVQLLQQLQQQLGLEIQWLVDLQIVRGLDYYTGTIFEANFAQDATLGSICWGGSYQKLTAYLDPKRADYSGVGGSIGISRILSKILQEQQVAKQTIADYLFLHFEESWESILQLAGTFLTQGKNIEIYPHPEKLGKQFAYADKKGIPQVIILGQGEKEQGIYKLKNMQTGTEKEISL